MSNYTIQSGDSLWKITRNHFGNSMSDNEISKKVEELSIFNNIKNPSLINVGQELDLSCFEELEETSNENSTQEKNEVATETEEVTTETEIPEKYVVQSGDSLWKITSNLYNNELSDNEISEKIAQIAKHNNISNPSIISKGQELDLSFLIENNLEKTETEAETSKQTETETKTKKETETEAQIKEDTNKNTTTEIAFRDGTPEDFKFETEEAKEIATKLYENSQRSALDNTSRKRPVPNVDAQGQVIANEEYYEATKEGALSGYTIMVNAGHGGYNEVDGAFDPGAVNQNLGLEEWAINLDYAEELTEALLEEGANVVLTEGYVRTLEDNIQNFAENYGEGNNENLKMISIHCNSNENKGANGTMFYYSDINDTDGNCRDLANSMSQAVEENGFKTLGNLNDNLFVLRNANQYGIENTLAEIGFISNDEEAQKLAYDENYKEKMIDSIVEGLIDNIA